MTKGTSVRLGAAYAAICLIWGSTYLAIKVGLESFDPFFYAGIRYVLATLLIVPVALALGVRFRGPARRWLPACAVGVLFVGVCNGLIFWGETRLDSGATALLITTSTLWTALLAPLLGDRAPDRRGWLGLAVGFAGTVVLVAPWQAAGVELAGALAVQASAVIWSATALWVRRLRADFEPLALTTVQMAAGALVLIAVAAARGRALVGPVTTRAVVALVFLVVFGSVVAFVSYFYLLRHWEAARVATSAYVNPVVAVVLGVSLLDEAVTARAAVGAVVVLAGVALVLQEQRPVLPG